MSIVLGDNIEYKGKKPLDSRMLFDTIADMKAYSENYLPDITLAFNKEDSKMYVFNRENEVDTTTGKWRVFEDSEGQVIQVATMPANPEQNRIVQYVGATNANYTNGYFYKAGELVYDETVSTLPVADHLEPYNGKVIYVEDEQKTYAVSTTTAVYPCLGDDETPGIVTLGWVMDLVPGATIFEVDMTTTPDTPLDTPIGTVDSIGRLIGDTQRYNCTLNGESRELYAKNEEQRPTGTKYVATESSTYGWGRVDVQPGDSKDSDYNELENKPLSIEEIGYYGYSSENIPIPLYSYPNEVPNTGDHIYAQIEGGGDIVDYTEMAEQEMGEGAFMYFKNDNGAISMALGMYEEIFQEMPVERNPEIDTVGSDVAVADDYKKLFNLSYLYDTSILQPENGQVLTMKNGKWTNKEIPEPNMSYNDLNNKLVGGNNIDISRQIKDYSAIQGPCGYGYHVPTYSEYQSVKTVLQSANQNGAAIYLHKGGFVDPEYAEESWITNQTFSDYYWTSSVDYNNRVYVFSNDLYDTSINRASDGYFVRAFKNEPVIPDGGWDEVVAGKVWHSEENGLFTVLVDNGTKYITLKDKNEGASETFDFDNPVYSEETCGYFFQRGNNFGFPYADGTQYIVSEQQDTSDYSWKNPYNQGKFVTVVGDWSTTTNRELWGGETQITNSYVVDNTLKYQAGENVTITNGEMYSAQKGPCDGGYHIPSYTELRAVRDVLANDVERITYYHLPLGGFINATGVASNIGTRGGVHAAEYDSGYYDRSYVWTYFDSTSSSGSVDGGNYGNLYNIRAFKNTPVAPDSTWTETVAGKVWYNASKGLITVYAQNHYYTMQDKNVGATEVYNYGDTVTFDNSGYYYQWGNNQGFYYQSYEDAGSAKVDASEYGPTNPYYGEFIKGASWFLLTGNYRNLWGGVTRIVDNVISVNIPDVSDASKDSDIAFTTINMTGREVTFNNNFITNSTLVSYTITSGGIPAGTLTASVDTGSVTFESTENETSLQLFVKFEKTNSNSTILS